MYTSQNFISQQHLIKFFYIDPRWGICNALYTLVLLIRKSHMSLGTDELKTTTTTFVNISTKISMFEEKKTHTCSYLMNTRIVVTKIATVTTRNDNPAI